MISKHKLFRHRRVRKSRDGSTTSTTHMKCNECRDEYIKEKGIDDWNKGVKLSNLSNMMNGEKSNIPYYKEK